jgi:hypothetical protein
LVQIYASARDEQPRDVVLKDNGSPERYTWQAVLRCRKEVDPNRISFVSNGEAADPAYAPPEPDVVSVVRAARRALNAVDERERENAVKLLAGTDGAEAREALLEALGHPAKAVRVLAARHCPEHNDPRVRPALSWTPPIPLRS